MSPPVSRLRPVLADRQGESGAGGVLGVADVDGGGGGGYLNAVAGSLLSL